MGGSVEKGVRTRLAGPTDAAAIAKVHVASWRTTYRDILPDALLEALSHEEHEQRWRDQLSLSAAGHFVYVAEADGEGVVGFAWGGPESRKSPVFSGEVYAIYVLESHQRMGIGRELMAVLARSLLGKGMSSLVVRLLDASPSLGFCERLKGERLDAQELPMENGPHGEVAYGWADIRALAGDSAAA